MIHFHELGEIDASQVAHVVRQERLLAARVRRFVGAELGDGIEGVGPVDEKRPRLTGLPCTVDDLVEDLTGILLPHHFLGFGVKRDRSSLLLRRPP